MFSVSFARLDAALRRLRFPSSTNQPSDSEASAEEADEPLAIPYALPVVQGGVFNIGYSTLGDRTQEASRPIQEFGTLTDGLRKTLTILQRALSMQLDNNVSNSLLIF